MADAPGPAGPPSGGTMNAPARDPATVREIPSTPPPLDHASSPRTASPLMTRAQLARSLTIASIVSVWLTLFNQYDRILAGTFDLVLAIQIALNFATPFTVSCVTAVWNNVRRAKALARPTAP